MTIRTTIAELQALHEDIQGVNKAPVVYPQKLNTTDLPLALTWPSDGEWRAIARQMNEAARTYLVEVYIAPLSAGAGIDAAAQLGIDLIEAFGQAYLAAAPFDSGAEILGGPGDIRDSGAMVLTYAGVDYNGFRFEVRVEEPVED